MSELRLVLTNACNFKCFFCHGEGSKTKVENRLDADDYKFQFDNFISIHTKQLVLGLTAF